MALNIKMNTQLMKRYNIILLDLVPDGIPDSNLLNPKPIGYLQAVNGIISWEVLIKQPHGVNCTNEGHLKSNSSVNINALQCDTCAKHGPQMKEAHDIWSLLPLKPLKTTANVFLVILVSRTSSGDPIKSYVFQQLKLTIKNQQQ